MIAYGDKSNFSEACLTILLYHVVYSSPQNSVDIRPAVDHESIYLILTPLPTDLYQTRKQNMSPKQSVIWEVKRNSQFCHILTKLVSKLRYINFWIFLLMQGNSVI